MAISGLELDEVPFEASATPEGNSPKSLKMTTQTKILGNSNQIFGVRTGVLIAIIDNGCTPLVIFDGQPGSAALAARTTIDLHGAHIGREVVLMFEDGNALQPVVLGCLQPSKGGSKPITPGQVEVDLDGERLLLTAKEQLVLRCGKACITLTKAGKVVIEGTYLSNRSTGVVRIKGGSIQLN